MCREGAGSTAVNGGEFLFFREEEIHVSGAVPQVAAQGVFRGRGTGAHHGYPPPSGGRGPYRPRYLFTGTRGTGKTTCARILAKAVNCLSPVDGEPCGRCEACRAVDAGTTLDITELDAASNNGVDQVRALREEAVYTPAVLKKRVYIIDEVHMLSTPAFNALLKILEEPPEHLMFILATTELHKVPATILSRCQRFSFKRILPRDMERQLLHIAQAEKIDLTADGAEILSRMAGAPCGMP